jgi:hypothetical protein
MGNLSREPLPDLPSNRGEIEDADFRRGRF